MLGHVGGEELSRDMEKGRRAMVEECCSWCVLSYIYDVHMYFMVCKDVPSCGLRAGAASEALGTEGLDLGGSGTPPFFAWTYSKRRNGCENRRAVSYIAHTNEAGVRRA
jgi:hypothetical protein